MNAETLEKLWNDSEAQYQGWSELCEHEKFNFALAIGRKNGLEEAIEVCRNQFVEFASESKQSAYNTGICDCVMTIRQRIKELP